MIPVAAVTMMSGVHVVTALIPAVMADVAAAGSGVRCVGLLPVVVRAHAVTVYPLGV